MHNLLRLLLLTTTTIMDALQQCMHISISARATVFCARTWANDLECSNTFFQSDLSCVFCEIPLYITEHAHHFLETEESCLCSSPKCFSLQHTGVKKLLSHADWAALGCWRWGPSKKLAAEIVMCLQTTTTPTLDHYTTAYNGIEGAMLTLVTMEPCCRLDQNWPELALSSEN